MMPGVVAGVPDVDLRHKTLTVGQGGGSAAGQYGYNDSLIDANDYGYLSKSQVTVPAGSRITALRNVGSFRSVTLEISQSSPPVSESEFLAAVDGLRIGSTVLSMASRTDAFFGSSYLSIRWSDPALPSPVGTTEGARIEIVLLYK